ncbi:MAG: hypothetical protein ABI977_17580 [Acidobacteriota bacterium]
MPKTTANNLAGELQMRLRMVVIEAIRSGLRIPDNTQPIPVELAGQIRSRLTQQDTPIALLVAELQAPRSWIYDQINLIANQEMPIEPDAITPASIAVQLRQLKSKQEQKSRRLNLGNDAVLAAELSLPPETIETARTVFSQSGMELGELIALDQEHFNRAVCNLYYLAHRAIPRSLPDSATDFLRFAGKAVKQGTEGKIGLDVLAEQFRLTDELMLLNARHFDGAIRDMESSVSPTLALRMWAWAEFLKALLTGKSYDKPLKAFGNRPITALLNTFLGAELAEELIAENKNNLPEKQQRQSLPAKNQPASSKPALLLLRDSIPAGGTANASAAHNKPVPNGGQVISMANHRLAKDAAAPCTFSIDGLNICRLIQPRSLAPLLTLALELLERGDDFICIFDASARWELKKEKPVYEKLMKEHDQYFTQTPRGEEADAYLLNVAGDDKPIISNDGFKDYAGQFDWLRDRPQLRQRLIGSMVVRGELIIQALKIRRKISGQLDGLLGRFEELVASKSQPSAQSESAG